jgi:hypothetical protein
MHWVASSASTPCLYWVWLLAPEMPGVIAFCLLYTCLRIMQLASDPEAEGDPLLDVFFNNLPENKGVRGAACSVAGCGYP